MTTGGRRDPDDLTAGLDRWLTATRDGAAKVHNIAHPSEGMSNETVIVTLTGPGRHTEATAERLIVRLPPLYPAFPHLDLAAQAALHLLLAEHGVPAPVPAVFEADTQWLGDPFLVLPFVEGHVPGQAPPFDPWITESSVEEQSRIESAFLDVLAALHRIDWSRTGIDRHLRGADRTLADEVQWWLDYIDWATPGPPLGRLVELLEWCGDNCPGHEPPGSLLWGDARLGNTIFGAGRSLVAALDWETATIGPAEADIAWYLALDSTLRYFTNGASVAGFGDHDTVVSHYEQRIGRALRDIAWHEIFAVARSICITYRQAEVARISGTRSALPGDERHPMFPMLDRWIEVWEPGSCAAPVTG